MPTAIQRTNSPAPQQQTCQHIAAAPLLPDHHRLVAPAVRAVQAVLVAAVQRHHLTGPPYRRRRHHHTAAAAPAVRPVAVHQAQQVRQSPRQRVRPRRQAPVGQRQQHLVIISAAHLVVLVSAAAAVPKTPTISINTRMLPILPAFPITPTTKRKPSIRTPTIQTPYRPLKTLCPNCNHPIISHNRHPLMHRHRRRCRRRNSDHPRATTKDALAPKRRKGRL